MTKNNYNKSYFNPSSIPRFPALVGRLAGSGGLSPNNKAVPFIPSPVLCAHPDRVSWSMPQIGIQPTVCQSITRPAYRFKDWAQQSHKVASNPFLCSKLIKNKIWIIKEFSFTYWAENEPLLTFLSIFCFAIMIYHWNLCNHQRVIFFDWLIEIMLLRPNNSLTSIKAI